MRRALDILAFLAGLATLAAFTFEEDPWQAGMAIGFLVCVVALVDLADRWDDPNLWLRLVDNSETYDGYKRVRIGGGWETLDVEVLPLDWDWVLWKDYSVTMKQDAQAAMDRMGVPAQAAVEKLGDQFRALERAGK